MTDLHDVYERAYVRRVRTPDPLLEQLAAQAVDGIEDPSLKWTDLPRLVAAAQGVGVPLAYVLDEIERRARARQQAPS